MTKRNQHIIVIKDVQYTRKDCEIAVLPPDKTKECRFPYESRSERRDQYRNAIFYAQQLLDEHTKNGAFYALCVDDQVDALTPRKRLNAVVVNGYVVQHS